jgi:hypothetical protein
MNRFLVVASVSGVFLLGGVLTAIAQDEHHGDARQEERHDEHAEHRQERAVSTMLISANISATSTIWPSGT